MRSGLSDTSDVPGATVFMDRNYIGTTPVDIKEVIPGEPKPNFNRRGGHFE